MQSVKPPVDVPISAQCRPLRSICQREECGLQLESAPADVALLLSQHPEQRGLLDRGAGFLHLLLVDQHAPGEDQSLRPFPEGAKPCSTSNLSRRFLIYCGGSLLSILRVFQPIVSAASRVLKFGCFRGATVE